MWCLVCAVVTAQFENLLPIGLFLIMHGFIWGLLDLDIIQLAFVMMIDVSTFTFVVLVCFQFCRMDQEMVLDDTSIFYSADMGERPEDVWGPIPLHHLSPLDLRNNPTVRLASHRYTLSPLIMFLFTPPGIVVWCVEGCTRSRIRAHIHPSGCVSDLVCAPGLFTVRIRQGNQKLNLCRAEVVFDWLISSAHAHRVSWRPKSTMRTDIYIYIFSSATKHSSLRFVGSLKTSTTLSTTTKHCHTRCWRILILMDPGVLAMFVTVVPG